MAYNNDGTKFRAFVWYDNIETELLDFSNVHALSLDALKVAVEKEIELIKSWGCKPKEVEFEILTEFGKNSQPLYRQEVA